MASPSQVLDYVATLKASLEDSTVMSAIEGLFDSKQAQQRELNGFALMPTPYSGQSALDFSDDEQRRLSMADVFLVTPDMCDLTDFASRTLPDDTVLTAENVPSPFGIAYFDKPWELVDVHGKVMRHHMITWGPAHDYTYGWLVGEVRRPDNRQRMMRHGIRVNFYSDRSDLVDEYNLDLGQRYGETQFWRNYRFQLSESCFWSWDATFRAYDEEIQLYRDVEGIDFTELPKMPTSESAVAFRLLAFWLLTMQEVTTLDEAPLDRHVKKRMGRMNLPQRVTVITLRRKSGPRSEGESHVEWHHRWIVKGHWRQQPYKDPLTGGTYTKPIWINPYIKGPDDKPIIQTEKVYRLSR